MELFLAAAEEAVVNELAVHPMVYGIAIFAALMFLLLAIMSLRSVALRPDTPASTDVAQPTQGSTTAKR
ncbi:hypothetical protein [Enteractinococcus helveticum]|uniref:Uncharacterized protein n=1 Tax=Enteractinococcus helveticum TaxID=1837282 RepID=A0A1B7LXM1_9MICC|nr:hypothetical protein [Enteractinococcus helveticum]OAV59910.1 hypothetical protein A6F49_14255 [Enteractinococcus helveticum]